MKQPIIGLVLRHFAKKRTRPNIYVKEEVKDAIMENGGLVIGIMPPPNEIIAVNCINEQKIYRNINKYIPKQKREILIEQIKMCDGIILQGGDVGDVHEIFIAKYCYENDIPLLGICEGQSNLIRGIGGTTKRVNNTEKHEQPSAEYVHDIKIIKNTLFYKIIGKSKIKVNSRHAHTPANIKNLIVSAYDDDGNIEVVEAPDKKFYLGTRFHPESLQNKDDNHKTFLLAFYLPAKNNNYSPIDLL